MTTRQFGSSPAARFLAAAIEWGRAQSEGDTRRANKVHDRDLIPALREVAITGGEEIESVVELADHVNPSVGLWAATFALRYETARGEAALTRLTHLPSLSIGFSAEVTLKEWRAGRLEVAWEEKVVSVR